MISRRLVRWLCATVLALPAVAQAHFLWVVTQSGEQAASVKVYFSESAAPDDPDLLTRVEQAEAWAIGARGEPAALSLKRTGDDLVAEVPSSHRSSTVVLRHNYGVLTRGEETFLLKYYAKCYPSLLPGTWKKVSDNKLLPLDVTPQLDGSRVALQVRWNGAPLADATVTVIGPGIDKKLEGPTDQEGVFRCALPETGMYSIRAKHTENTAGEMDGKSYKSVRHYSTLALRFAPAQLAPAEHNFPALAEGVTSFGGAISGDWLYVYGGHYGGAHHYVSDDQSGDFIRLNLRDPKAWEKLPGGPKLTGLAMAAYKGRIYRVGGFTAKNKENEPQDLWSQADFACFNPDTQKWENLSPLPAGRSSHDAAVIGSTLYVVGGWNMRGKEGETQWHDSALSIDLSAEKLQWQALPTPPFQRRALTLAEWNGKLYCLGGMQNKGGTTTATAVFDPQSGVWSEGPALLGSPMDGFGASSFAAGNALFVTTMSGAIQRLNARGDAWEFVGQLTHPRFFHRLLPWSDGQLVVVGGASMTTGKTPALELLPAAAGERVSAR
jgi:N-acetylneuraminic acid mutarotase